MHPELRESIPWIMGAVVVVLMVIAYLSWSAPDENLLPDVYGVIR